MKPFLSPAGKSMVLLAAMVAAAGCNTPLKKNEKQMNGLRTETMNPAVYFEIPVVEMERAMAFYQKTFGFSFERETIDGNEMALLPFREEAKGMSGALAKGEVYRPTLDGVILYLHCSDIDATLRKAVQSGGAVLYPKTDNGTLGFVAEVKDTEVNRIGLHQPPRKG